MNIETIDTIYRDCIQNLGYNIILPLQSSYRAVYQVEKEGQLRTAKITSHGFPGCNQVKTENKALDLAREIPGVAGKIFFHECFSHKLKIYTIVRHYISGVVLGEAGSVLGVKQQAMLEETVHELHRRGISNLDLHHANIIISPDTVPYLIDLGLAKFKSEHGRADFKKGISDDLFELECLFQHYAVPEH